MSVSGTGQEPVLRTQAEYLLARGRQRERLIGRKTTGTFSGDPDEAVWRNMAELWPEEQKAYERREEWAKHGGHPDDRRRDEAHHQGGDGKKASEFEVRTPPPSSRERGGQRERQPTPRTTPRTTPRLPQDETPANHPVGGRSGAESGRGRPPTSSTTPTPEQDAAADRSGARARSASRSADQPEREEATTASDADGDRLEDEGSSSDPPPAAARKTIDPIWLEDGTPYRVRHSTPTSGRRRASQKANGQRSSGPSNELGKSVSSMNRLTHGFYSEQPYIRWGPLAEDPRQVARDIEDFVRAMHPYNRAARRVAIRMAGTLRRGGLLEKLFDLIATKDRQPSQPISHSLAEARRARRQWQVALDTISWVDAVYASTASARSWNWRTIISPTLQPGQAQVICKLLDARGLHVGTGKTDLQTVRVTPERAWERVLKTYLRVHFDNHIDNLAIWCEETAEALEREAESFERDYEYEVTSQGQREMLGVMPALERIIELQTKTSNSLRMDLAVFIELQKSGGGEDPDPEREPLPEETNPKLAPRARKGQNGRGEMILKVL